MKFHRDVPKIISKNSCKITKGISKLQVDINNTLARQGSKRETLNLFCMAQGVTGIGNQQV